MVPRSWESNYIDNRRLCALMILERQSHKELESASTGISIQFLLYYNIFTYIYIYNFDIFPTHLLLLATFEVLPVGLNASRARA